MAGVGSAVRSTASSGSQVYTSGRAVAEYLLFHFGSKTELFPYASRHCIPEALSFPENCAGICASMLPRAPASTTRVLDIGCAVGGTSFHLSKHFGEVVGLDFSQQFIDAANNMKSGNGMKYEVYTEGTQTVELTASLPEGAHPERCLFAQGDACDLKPGLLEIAKLKSSTNIEPFDVILGSNLLCRLPSPRKFLSSLYNLEPSLPAGLLKPHGYLVLVSPYSWLEEYTAREEWLMDPSRVDVSPSTSCNNSFNGLSAHIAAHCNTRSGGADNGGAHYGLRLVRREDVPFMIREHARKFQFGISDCTIWQNVLLDA